MVNQPRRRLPRGWPAGKGRRVTVAAVGSAGDTTEGTGTATGSMTTDWPAFAPERAAREQAAPDESGGQARRRPWYVWAVPFVAIFITLCIRNSFMFSTRLYEMADFGADSILVERARHLTLLVGNYSRNGFYHPGPAYMYVMAAGESLFYDALHIVPSPWNGQVISLYLLNSLLAGLGVLVVYGWARTRGALAATALLLVWAVLHVGIYSAPWLPYQDIPTFTLFLIATGSVAAGHQRDGWIATLAGWLLIHRYAVMLLFVPALAVVAVLLAAWPARRRLGSAIGGLIRAPRIWVPVVVLSAIFALPIALETVLHWPGQFARYFSYSNGSKAGAHNFSATVQYVLWFWGSDNLHWIFIAGAAAGTIAALVFTKGPLRRYLAALAILSLVATVLFVYYATNGIDEINEHYIGYFYWGVPLTAALILLLAALGRLPAQARAGRLVTGGAAAGAVAALATFGMASGTVTTTTAADPEAPSKALSGTDPKLATAVQLVASRAHGKPVVIHLYHSAWPEMTGFLILAERNDVTACIAQPFYQTMVTTNLICTPAQIKDGVGFYLDPLKNYVPYAIIRLRRAIIVPYPLPTARPRRRPHYHHVVRHHHGKPKRHTRHA